MRRWTAVVVITVGLASGAAACAANSSGALSATAAHNLRLAVEAVRQAAASGSYSQLQQAVASLEALVKREQQSGDVSSARANDILNAADILLTDAKPKPSPTPTVTIPPTTTTLPSPTPTPTPTATSSPTPSPTVTILPSGSASPLVNVSAGAHSKNGQRSHLPR